MKYKALKVEKNIPIPIKCAYPDLEIGDSVRFETTKDAHRARSVYNIQRKYKMMLRTMDGYARLWRIA